MSALHDAARRVVAAWVSTKPNWIEECNAAVLALDAALKAEPAQEPFSSLRDLLTQAAAMAVAAERAGQYEGASWVADAVLAQEQHGPAQEPVAWMDNSGHPKHIKHLQSATERRLYGPLRPLYTAPPQRPPLTDEEMRKLWSQYGYKSALCMRFARAVERKVRGEKE